MSNWKPILEWYRKGNRIMATTERQRRIIQLLNVDDEIYGLDEDGTLYALIEQKNSTPEWEFVVESPYR